MKKSFYLLLVFFFMIASCKEAMQDPRNFIANIIIDATEISNNKFSLTDIIDSAYFIPLETTSECLIKQIDKIVFDNDKIFVLDCRGNNKILVFDRQGKFMWTVGKVGQGPGEYIEACDFCVNKRDKMIYIVCERERIMQYNYSGDFVKQIKMDLYAESIEYSNSHFYFIGNQKDFFNLAVTDIEGKIVDKFFQNKNWGENLTRLPHPLQKMDSLVYYFGYLDDNIYGIRNFSEVFVQYRMDFGKATVDLFTVKNFDDAAVYRKLLASRGYIQYWIQNSGYFVCYYFDKAIPVMHIYNKEKDISRNFYYKNIQNQYAAKICFFEYLTDTDELVAVVQPADLLENVESIENEDDKNCIKNMGLDEEMNPLLYVVKTK
jgi:hypothetical protein